MKRASSEQLNDYFGDNSKVSSNEVPRATNRQRLIRDVSVGVLEEHRSYNILRAESVKENSELRVRFMSKVTRSSDVACWEWNAAKNEQGYGAFNIEGKTWLAHRVAYFIFRGETPKDLTIDHKCVNRWCVNPFHMQLVSLEENRRLAKERRDSIITHCPNGHELVEGNLVKHMAKQGLRKCLICFRAYDRKRQIKYRGTEDAYKSRVLTDTCLKGHPINETNTWMDSLQHDTVACKVCYAEYTKTPMEEVQKIGAWL